jgi:large subunit ribosomal protein L21
MFAVVEIAKKQYIVQTGDVLDVQKLKDSAGEIIFDKVLLVANQDKVSIGTPYLDGAKIKATIEGQRKGKKVIVYKYKRRKKYRKKQGHRQKYTTIKITDISSDIIKGSEKETTKESTSKKPTSKKTSVKKPISKKSSSQKSA